MPSLAPLLPLTVDSTMMTCFRSCPRKFFLEFVLGLRPPGLSIDLHAGACFASALEETYRGIYVKKLSLADALDVAHARFLIEWGDFEIPKWKRTSKTMDRIWTAVVGGLVPEDRGYFDEWPPHSDTIRPFISADGTPTLEYTFCIPLEPAIHPTTSTNFDSGYVPDGLMHSSDGHDYFPLHPSGQPFNYVGRFDMLGQHTQTGRPIPLDNKTTGSIGDQWARHWPLRHQFIGYTWACQQCGLDVQEVCVRGTGVLKESIKQVESIQPYPAELISRWYEQLRRDLWRIRRMWDEQYWDFNFGESCTSYGNCVFMDACTSHQPEVWLSDLEVRRWNPLNKNPSSVDKPAEVSAR